VFKKQAVYWIDYYVNGRGNGSGTVLTSASWIRFQFGDKMVTYRRKAKNNAACRTRAGSQSLGGEYDGEGWPYL
jgi:hypothetical protein